MFYTRISDWDSHFIVSEFVQLGVEINMKNKNGPPEMQAFINNFLENNPEGRFTQSVGDLVFYKAVLEIALFEIVKNGLDKDKNFLPIIGFKFNLVMMKMNSVIEGFNMEVLGDWQKALETPVQVTFHKKVIYKGPVIKLPEKLETGFNKQFPEYSGLMSDFLKQGGEEIFKQANMKNIKINQIISDDQKYNTYEKIAKGLAEL
jgi:hypothetical protein